MQSPLCSDFSLLQCLSHDSENRSGWHVCFVRSFFTWFASKLFQQGADDNHRCVVLYVTGRPLLGSSWMLTRPSPKWNSHHDTVLSPQTSCKALWISVGFFPRKFSILMCGRWSLVAARDLTPVSILLPFQGSVLQNRNHVACQNAHSVLYWSLAHNCRENQKDCIILQAAQAQCTELL